ncbi:MAG: cytochrome c3 family protein [Pseudomonadota bacterium]
MSAMNKLGKSAWLISIFGMLWLLTNSATTQATVVSDVAKTKHNLSASSPGTVKAVSETQTCVFCHAAHNGEPAVAPLWNRTLSTLTYTLYSSSTMESTTAQPGGDSKLCLSCHDGTLAIGTVNVLNGLKNTKAIINMNGTSGGFMAAGSGELTGDTSNLGGDLTNDHPISFTYDNTLANNDGELRTLPVVSGGITQVGNSVRGTTPKPIFPLKSDRMECSTCHDPHTWENDPAKGNHKFLRGNRFQQTQPMGTAFDATADSMCLGCHDKLSSLWAYSSHANELVANQTYLAPTATQHEFPTNVTVWSVSCLNCHDTHSVQGSTRLLREGTDSTAIPKSGGNTASEETCFQCHSPFGQSVITPLTTVPDIKSDFALTIHMPIATAPERHDTSSNFNDSLNGGPVCVATGGDQCGKDLLEPQAKLGKVSAGGSINNRHAECSDCHNPHRTTKNRLFNDDAAVTTGTAGTHKHDIITDGVTSIHNNLVSGSLRGTFGVEPVYGGNEFSTAPISFNVKRGDGGSGAISAVSSTYVTREYQVCLKCHSGYGYDTSSPIALPASNIDGGTVSGTNGVSHYSDISMEIQAPIGHKGSPASTTTSGADIAFSANNHRSWHPIMDNTGRTSILRGNASPNLLRAPFNGSNTDGGTELVVALGEQTMHCSDCHGSGNALGDASTPVGGENGKPWGPHGSNNDFLLKGPWDTTLAVPATADNLCFRCHDANQYADATGAPATTLQSGFSAVGNDAYGVPMSNLHQRHAYYTTQGGVPPTTTWPPAANGTYRCTMCHTGTAHGWKNKNFLVNLNDLGPEITALGGEIAPGPIVLGAGAPVPTGTQAPAFTIPTGYSNSGYYQGALLRVNSFAASGNWVKTDCGGCH